ncbi:uncharacterized protein LOC123555585 [Mercenaria mercenaria]|uniref:uncharacterized protein LOC123555585 n=1 Tax=Mercenaria mercenaria TaxID=6596 RepID=UPI001E1D74EA|nr:uncharacterized protein LOC123555585 [Mercenaria mercenaria]
MWSTNGNAALCIAVGVIFVYNVAANAVHDIMQLHQLNHPAVKRQNLDYEDPHAGPQDQEMCFTIPHLQALKEQFASYIDTNRDERASKEEILDYLKKYNPTTTPEQVEKFIARRDKDGDGSVDFIPDYLMEVSSPDFDLNTAKEWFDLEDTNGDGYVSRDELIAIAVKVGMPREEAERTAVGYYMSADQNGDNKLSWEEYKPLFLAK